MANPPELPSGHKRKKVVALRSIESARRKATAFEISSLNRRDRDHYGQVSHTGLCLPVQIAGRALRVFLKGIPFGVCCYARKEWLRSLSSSFMVDLLGEINTSYHENIAKTGIGRSGSVQHCVCVLGNGRRDCFAALLCKRHE